jgi:hypothetical protein
VQHIFDMRRHNRAGDVVQRKVECQLVRKSSIARPTPRVLA